jgi:hypothetical protein
MNEHAPKITIPVGVMGYTETKTVPPHDAAWFLAYDLFNLVGTKGAVRMACLKRIKKDVEYELNRSTT